MTKTLDPEEYEAYYQEIDDECGCEEPWECLSRRRNE